MFLTLAFLNLLLGAQTIYTVCASGCTYTNTIVGLQNAVTDIPCGGIIEITAGQSVTNTTGSPLFLKYKSGCATYTTIRSSGVGALALGARVTPSDTAKLAKLTVGFGPYAVITNEVDPVTKNGAAWWKFHGIEITAYNGFMGDLVEFGSRSPTLDYVNDNEIKNLAHHIYFDQCYFHGDSTSTDGPRRGIRANLASMTVTNSWFENFKNQNGESNAIGGWNSLGPFLFKNNHFEAVAITTLFGGAQPNISGLRANGLFFLGNHYYRSWKYRVRYQTVNPSGTCLWDSNGGEYYQNTSNGTYWRCDGGVWTSILAANFSPYYWQKNIFELKNSWRTFVEGNYFENAWNPATQNQYGAMFLFNLVDNDPPAGTVEPFATVGYVKIKNNYGRRTPWLASLGSIGGPYYLWHNNLSFENNVFEEIGDSPYTLPAAETNGSKWGGNFMAFPANAINVSYSFNTFISRNPIEARSAYLFGTPLSSQTTQAGIMGNIFSWNKYGVYNDNDGGSLWNSISNGFAVGYNIGRNVVINNESLSIYGRPSPIVNIAYNVESPSTPMPCVGSTNEMTGTGATYNGNCGFPSSNSAVGFLDYASHNYTLDSSSGYRRWGPLGKDPGARFPIVTWSTAGVSVSNATLPTFLNFEIKSAKATSSKITFTYTAYDSSTCDLIVSAYPDLSSPTTVTDSGGYLDRSTEVTGLAANTRYYWRALCAGTYYREGIALTNP